MYWIEITEKNLLEFKDQLSWKGEGTIGNPIIIESLEGLTEYLRFKDITSHIRLRDLTLCELYVRFSANIEMENCKVYYLWIKFCHDIKLTGSSIVNLNMEFSRGNIISNNQLHERSWWTDNTLDASGEKGETSIIYLNLCAGFFFIVLGIIFTLNLGILFAWIIPVAFYFLIPAIKFYRRRAHTKEFPPNIFNANQQVDLKDLEEKYSASYDI